jgi:hypothetical protein
VAPAVSGSRRQKAEKAEAKDFPYVIFHFSFAIEKD